MSMIAMGWLLAVPLILVLAAAPLAKVTAQAGDRSRLVHPEVEPGSREAVSRGG